MSRIGRLLNTSAEVWRFARVPDGMGGYSESWASVGAERARFSQPSAHERQAADQSESRMSHVVYLRPGANVKRGDELRTPLVVYDVLAVFQPSEPNTYTRADCRARQP